MDSKPESQALAPTKPSLDGFVYDWYIRVCVHFLDIPSGNTGQIQVASYIDMEGSIVQLCLGNIPTPLYPIYIINGFQGSIVVYRGRMFICGPRDS